MVIVLGTLRTALVVKVTMYTRRSPTASSRALRSAPRVKLYALVTWPCFNAGCKVIKLTAHAIKRTVTTMIISISENPRILRVDICPFLFRGGRAEVQQLQECLDLHRRLYPRIQPGCAG